LFLNRLVAAATGLSICAVLLTGVVQSQEMSNLDRGRAEDMLRVVAGDVRKHYYDPKFHGVDWDAVVARAKQQIDKAPSMDMAVSYIAAALDSLRDSHTIFYPPGRLRVYDFGWQYQMIGDRCFFTHIHPKSDAEAKGIRPGDEILTIDGIIPDRNTLWKLDYILVLG
jgi:C-terminal processing protease CtpA/Prc